MNNRDILFALHHLPGIGSRTIAQLIRCFENLNDLRTLNPGDAGAFGLTPARARQLCSGLAAMEPERIAALQQTYHDKGISWITRWDEDYPELLDQSGDPPWVLYYRGDWALTRRPCIAMVGTRTPTAYGRTSAERLAEGISEGGCTVVSGLARGIDSAAHIGALRQKGKTIAVLGCAIDEVYPPENKVLYRNIAEQGLLLSEYGLGTKSHPGLFPQRNRIIAGLSLGVVVVEAALRSGSLITADQALEASRDVFAVPGPISSPKSQGTLSLLKQGAKLVSSPEDILEEYENLLSREQRTYKSTNSAAPPLSADELATLDLIAIEPIGMDRLLAETQFTFGHLHSVLINLLMMRRITELPGSIYTIT